MDSWYGAFVVGRQRSADYIRQAKSQRLAERVRVKPTSRLNGIPVLLVSLVKAFTSGRGSESGSSEE